MGEKHRTARREGAWGSNTDGADKKQMCSALFNIPQRVTANSVPKLLRDRACGSLCLALAFSAGLLHVGNPAIIARGIHHGSLVPILLLDALSDGHVRVVRALGSHLDRVRVRVGVRRAGARTAAGECGVRTAAWGRAIHPHPHPNPGGRHTPLSSAASALTNPNSNPTALTPTPNLPLTPTHPLELGGLGGHLGRVLLCLVSVAADARHLYRGHLVRVGVRARGRGRGRGRGGGVAMCSLVIW